MLYTYVFTYKTFIVKINFNKIVGLEVMRIVPKLHFLYVSTETKLPTPIRHHTTRNLEEVNHSKSKQIQGIRLNNNNPSLDFSLTFMYKVSWVSYDGSRCSAQTESRLWNKIPYYFQTAKSTDTFKPSPHAYYLSHI